MSSRSIAVVGLAGRFPGAPDVSGLWANLRAGVESIHRFTPEELARAGVPAAALADPAYVRAAPLLEGADRFAASFFGLSRREAERTDPEHRLFLETCWAALEDAGHAGRGEGVGVFAGGGGSFDSYLVSRSHFNAALLAETASLEHIGNDKDYLSTRVSHRLDLRGPSYTLQCACSTSLVAVHVACQSLLAGETDLALAGGVNVRVPLVSGYTWTEGGIRSRDGRCRPFDAAADGTVFGSGVGVVALRRLEDALADGDCIRAVIRGSAVNNDGARKTSYWSSGAEGQARAMREALAVAGVDPATVGLVEAHGTATAVGDPVEVFALNRAYGAGAGPRTCALGSLKSNLGHLEAAAGVAGLIKAVLALQHGVIPPTLHFREPNPRVPFEHGPFFVNAQPLEWPRPAGGGPRRAAVNSLGIGGTNAHVVLEEAPAPAPAPSACRPVHVIPVSARSPAALRALSGRYAGALDDGAALADAAHTAAVGRVHMPHRRVVVAADSRAAAQALRQPPADGAPRRGRPRVAFLYSGQGSQYAGMGAELARVPSAFAETLDECDRVLAARLGWSPRVAMAGEAGEPGGLDRTLVAQPALFVLEAALTRLLASWGIAPDVVLGHSVGEYAAAWAAGVFDLETALSLLALRAREMDAAPGEGAMAAVLAPEETVARIAAAAAPGVGVAVRNGPENVVLSGARAELDRAVDALEAAGIRCRPLRASHAFHSPLMAGAAERVAAAAAGAALREPGRTFISNLTGEVAAPGLLDAAYWGRQLREPVRFGDCLRTLAGLGVDVVVEIGPGKVLAHHAREALPEAVEVVHTLERGAAEWATALAPVRALYERGAALDWAGIAATGGGRRAPLPTYPFERERYWLEAGPAPGPLDVPADAHPLLGRAVPLADVPGRRWQCTLAAESASFIADHVVYGRPVLVGVGYLETALSAARQLHGAGPATLWDVVVPGALAFEGPERRLLQTALDADGTFRIHSAPAEDAAAWTLHASGRVAPGAGAAPAAELAAVRLRCAREIPRDEYYGTLAVFYGPSLRNLSRLWKGRGEALGLAELPGAADPRYVLHPALLDACLQVVFALLYEDGETSRAWVPVGFERVEVWRPGASRAWSHVVRRPVQGAERSRAFDVELIDPGGGVVARLSGVRLTRTSGGAGERLRAGGGPGWVHDLAWRPAEGGAEQAERLDRTAAAHALRALRALGWSPAPGERVDAEGLAARLRVAPGREAVLHTVLRALETRGVLVARDGGWTVAAVPEGDAEAPAGGGAEAETALLARCGAGLPALLRGETAALELLFPGAALEPVGAFHRSPASFRWVYGALEAALREAAAGTRRGLRVLEAGAGSGGATEVVLRVLGGRLERYDLTDVSTRFLEGARHRFGDPAFMACRRLDLEEDPRAQGFGAGEYDLVVAANVVHATRRAGASLGRLKRLLRPDGTLVLLEGTSARPWLELTFGLTDGWRLHAGDPLRPDAPLMDADGWRAALADAGFGHVRVDADPRPHAPFAQALVQARTAPFAPAAAAAARAWIVAGDDPALAGELVRALAALGERAAAWEGPADAARLPAAARVVFARTAAGEPDPGAGGSVPPALEAALAWSRALAARGGDEARLFLVTRGAQGAPGGCARPDLAPLWGLGRVAALEHPELGCRRIDLDAAGEPGEGALLAEELLLAAAGDDELARRGGAWWRPRLAPAAEPDGGALALAPDGAYVVTGGLGGLGLALARRLAARGARRIHLLSRRDPGEAEAEAIRALQAEGVAVRAAACDVGDLEALRAALEAVRAESGPIRGVFHAAGVLGDGPLLLQDAERFARVLRPKVQGGWNLHLLAADDPLDHFVLFSSAANLLGSAGQSSHAAACAFLDALAAYRAERGRPGVSLAWGPWLEVGAAIREGTLASWEERGIRGMPVAGALDALEQAAARPVPVQGIFAVDWARFDRRAHGFFAEVAGPADPHPPVSADAASLAAPAEAPARGDWLEEMVRGSLGLRPEQPLDPRAGLFDLGLDSLTAIQLRNRLQKHAGRPLPVTLVLDYPTLQGLRAYFAPQEPAAAEPLAAERGPGEAEPAVAVSAGGAETEAELEDRLASVLERLRY